MGVRMGSSWMAARRASSTGPPDPTERTAAAPCRRHPPRATITAPTIGPGFVNQDFRAKSTLGVALSGAVLLTPFTINHVEQGRMLLAAGTGIIVVALAVLAWRGSQNRYNALVTFGALTPAMLFFLGVSLYEQGVIGALWCFPAILAFYFTLPERLAWTSNAGLYAVAVPCSRRRSNRPWSSRGAQGSP